MKQRCVQARKTLAGRRQLIRDTMIRLGRLVADFVIIKNGCVE